MKKVIIGIVAVFVVIGVIGAMSGGEKTQNEVVQTETTTSENKVEEEKEKVSAEAIAALGKAELYATTMSMSKKAIYNQLISEVEGFSKEDAQYAIDNVVADWNNNALEKAKMYQETMHMSRKAIHQQLTASAGEAFTKEEADYALENLPN